MPGFFLTTAGAPTWGFDRNFPQILWITMWEVMRRSACRRS